MEVETIKRQARTVRVVV